jgi:ABC-type Mn2+/Zn2+ transport system ATPase subunit
MELDDLRLRAVSKRYGVRDWVLSEVDMDVPPGESISVSGANGSGKSTLLRMIAGVTRPTRGRITGRPPIVGYVPDRFPAIDAMSSIAYLVHVGRIRGLGTAAAGGRGRELLERLELAGGLRTPIRALSKGNAQKVALAQALMVPPDLLILDEPWSGLDAAAHAVLGEILDDVVRDGGTVVYTDHRESIGRSRSTLSYGVDGGRVEVITQPDHQPQSLAVHVVLTESPVHDTRRIDWNAIDAVLGVTATAGFLHLRINAEDCDDLLLFALRNGWSVAEVRREATTAHGSREDNTWAR